MLKNYEESRELVFSQDNKEGWIIKIDGLGFAYTENDQLIQNLSLEIREHDIVWIKGKNGSGKSTLLKLRSIQICEILDISGELLKKPCGIFSSGERKKIYLA